MADHNLLIAKLSQDASPIRRPWQATDALSRGC
jgi:hypothetical protein